ncbi:MAG: efflux RND transporter periplasmic adaptor subunit [Nitrospinae bacterium]|nr:efflux RND transporter periplasmic adaptor subunit [Nitrospinota bacterium]
MSDPRPLLALTLAVGLALSACAGDDAPQAAVTDRKSVRVKVITLAPTLFRQKLTLPGAAKPSAEVTVTAEVAGKVAALGFEKGATVKKGAPLVRLDDRAMAAETAQARAARDMAALELDKLSALAKVEGDVSPFELDNRRLTLAQAQARLDGAEATLARYRIGAPLAGIAVSRPLEVGAIASPGVELTRIVATDPMKLSVGVPETAVADFSVGKKATVVFDAFPDERYEGAVVFLSPEVDPRARVFACELSLPNPAGRLRPEMSAKATFVRKEIPDALLIPQTAVLELPEAHAVFVVDDKGIARQKLVTVADHTGEEALVDSGLSPGDRLVVTGHRSLLDGDKVLIVE